jgi:hypothetical protein
MRSTIISVHQPQYLPWLGYFNKIARSDYFVLGDDVQFVRNEWQNRNRISKISSRVGWQWLTVPVPHPSFPIPLRDVMIDSSQPWAQQHLRKINSQYGTLPYYKKYIEEIAWIIKQPWSRLAALNTALLKHFCKLFDISTTILEAPQLPPGLDASERLAYITAQLGGDAYLSGVGGREYLKLMPFEKQGLNVSFQLFTAAPYVQHHFSPRFVSHLSIIDALFNCGVELTRKHINSV